jgi:hypothetical protein
LDKRTWTGLEDGETAKSYDETDKTQESEKSDKAKKPRKKHEMSNEQGKKVHTSLK